MKINWIYVLASIALLLPPIPFSPNLRRATSGSRRQIIPSAVPAFRVWQNWADFVRALLGTFLINSAFGSDEPEGGEASRIAHLLPILCVALLLQTIRSSKGIQIFAPVFYLCGTTFVLGDYLPGSFAIVVGWLFALAGKNLNYQLPAMAVALVAAGYVLGMVRLSLLLACGLILAPPILALLFKKRLMFVATLPAS